MINWTVTDDYICGMTNDFTIMPKLAIFDLDDTLIKTKSGKKFAIDNNDWIFYSDNVLDVLRKYVRDNYCVIIVSNQGGIEKGLTNAKLWMKKIESIIGVLGIQIKILCSTGINKYRKPFPTLFNNMIIDDNSDGDVKFDIDNSFYCGDACGRKGDHSDCDLKFALNCGLSFVTPDKLFLSKKENIPKIEYPKLNVKPKNEYVFKPYNKEMCIMVGYPASGKSHYAQTICDNYGYVIVNQDKMKTKKACIKLVQELINNNKSMIIDATNPNESSRKIYIDIAKEYSYRVRVLHITTSYELSLHRNNYRLLTQGYKIPEIAYRMYKSKFTEPNIDENIDEIIKLEPSTVDNNKDYNQYLY